MLLFPVSGMSASLEALTHRLHTHLLHQHERIELHHLLTVLRMFVGAIHPVACVSEFTYDIGMQVYALVCILAFREEFTSLCRMEILAVCRRFIAVREVSASLLFFLGRSCINTLSFNKWEYFVLTLILVINYWRGFCLFNA